MTHLIKVAILGAECTGKSTLAEQLLENWGNKYAITIVPEYLREFVDTEQRTPHSHEQVLIAQTQLANEQKAAELYSDSEHEFAILLCDTTPLLTNLYSEVVFGKPDQAVQEMAKNHNYDLTIVTDLEFPWIPDGIMRDGPVAQTKVHYRLLAKLDAWKIPYTVISGNPKQRLQSTQKLILAYLSRLQQI